MTPALLLLLTACIQCRAIENAATPQSIATELQNLLQAIPYHNHEFNNNDSTDNHGLLYHTPSISMRNDYDISRRRSDNIKQYQYSPLPPLVSHDMDCQNYIRWLFFCWILIGMLLTSNLVTCLFAFWAKKSASNLTDKAILLAMAANEENKIVNNSSINHSNINASNINHSNMNHSIHKSQILARNKKFQSCHIIPSQYQKEALDIEIFSPIPSNYSKSYSYAAPLITSRSATFSKQPSQR